MSLIVNPRDPTPKQSSLTPNVQSLAYYLANSTPDGKSSYDDCKKDATPIKIPDVKPGTMFEFKSANFGWQLYYTESDAYKDFLKQVEAQNEGVIKENQGRRIIYCLGSQALTTKAYDLLHEKFPSSRFLVCDGGAT